MRVVLSGASGQLGSYLLGRLLERGHEVEGWSGRAIGERLGVELKQVELSDRVAVERALARAGPDLVIHAGALSTVEGVRREPERGRMVNVEATAWLADWCGQRGRRLLYTSTDLVFDGRKAWNREDDPAHPSLAYGRSKLEGERFVRDIPGGLVVRLSLLYGRSRSGRATYLDRAIEGLRRGEPQTFFEDEYRTPLDLDSAARGLVCLAETDFSGLLHLGGEERLSRFELMTRVANALGIEPGLIRGNRQREVVFSEPRPVDVSLDTALLGGLLPGFHRWSVEEAVARFLDYDWMIR